MSPDGLLGNITASQRVVIQSNARVEGNIHTPSLSIRDGAGFEGECVFETMELSRPPHWIKTSFTQQASWRLISEVRQPEIPDLRHL